jgi:hypothetical protein
LISSLTIFSADLALPKNRPLLRADVPGHPLYTSLGEAKSRSFTEPEKHYQRLSAVPKPLFSDKMVVDKTQFNKSGHPILDIKHSGVPTTQKMLVAKESVDKFAADKKSEKPSKLEQLKSKFSGKDSAKADNKETATDVAQSSNSSKVRRVLDAYYYPKEKASEFASNSALLPPKCKFFHESPKVSWLEFVWVAEISLFSTWTANQAIFLGESR